jgi:hypothetical protein
VVLHVETSVAGGIGHTFDWRSHHDPRSRQYPIRGVVRTPPISRTWRVPVTPLDQGREGACVGFGWTHEAMATPVAIQGLNANFAHGVYKDAQLIDEWPGNDYSGTSVLAGAKTMKIRKYLKEYRWAFGIEDVKLALGTTGPVVLGINWYEGMYDAPGGVLSVGGPLAGGHCILAHAYRKPGLIFPDEHAIGLFNSWGPSWGINGRAWIRASELSRLLKEDGEACVPYVRSWNK